MHPDQERHVISTQKAPHVVIEALHIPHPMELLAFLTLFLFLFFLRQSHSVAQAGV